MSKIAFFCIPAQGHTNPTLEVVRELVGRGHEVRYYSYDSMREKIETAGAEYISCDKYDIQMKLDPKDGERIGRDIGFSTEILVRTTLAMDDALLNEMKAWEPDCIVADSMAVWGKLAARKLGVPFVSSTTTFAFNQSSARYMKQSIGQLFAMLFALPKANRWAGKLREKGYPVKNVLDIIQNDNETDTIVYTSPEFQPCSRTFSEKYAFVGPSIRQTDQNSAPEKKCIHRSDSQSAAEGKTVYISMGTVNNLKESFFRNCLSALKNSGIQVIMSVGDFLDIDSLGEIPDNFRVERSVDQIAVLQRTDVFLTHCGMNSVSEALYFRVPLILYPQTPEQGAVAMRVSELGAGLYLKEESPRGIREAVQSVLQEQSYQSGADRIAESFRRCGGAEAAADKILECL